MLALQATALLVGISASVLAYRRAGRKVWLAHGALALVVATSMAVMVKLHIYGEMVPWWQTGVGYFISLGLPPIITGFAARAADRRSPLTGRWRMVAATMGALVLSGYLGWRVAALVLPDVVRAVA